MRSILVLRPDHSNRHARQDRLYVIRTLETALKCYFNQPGTTETRGPWAAKARAHGAPWKKWRAPCRTLGRMDFEPVFRVFRLGDTHVFRSDPCCWNKNRLNCMKCLVGRLYLWCGHVSSNQDLFGMVTALEAPHSLGRLDAWILGTSFRWSEMSFFSKFREGIYQARACWTQMLFEGQTFWNALNAATLCKHVFFCPSELAPCFPLNILKEEVRGCAGLLEGVSVLGPHIGCVKFLQFLDICTPWNNLDSWKCAEWRVNMTATSSTKRWSTPRSFTWFVHAIVTRLQTIIANLLDSCLRIPINSCNSW